VVALGNVADSRLRAGCSGGITTSSRPMHCSVTSPLRCRHFPEVRARGGIKLNWQPVHERLLPQVCVHQRVSCGLTVSRRECESVSNLIGPYSAARLGYVVARSRAFCCANSSSVNTPFSRRSPMRARASVTWSVLGGTELASEITRLACAIVVSASCLASSALRGPMREMLALPPAVEIRTSAMPIHER
jgi:hypothetical protein